MAHTADKQKPGAFRLAAFQRVENPPKNASRPEYPTEDSDPAQFVCMRPKCRRIYRDHQQQSMVLSLETVNTVETEI
jgi:hypothetical protein